MLGKLFRPKTATRPARPPQRQSRRSRGAASVPPGTTVYAVGDIHGRLDLLLKLEDQIRAHANADSATRRVLIYIGDYVDRGYESRAVIDHLLLPPPVGFTRVCLKGNHEDFMLRFIGEEPEIGPMWIVNGGRETLMSYGVMMPPGIERDDQIAACRESLIDALPSEHLAFLQGLTLSHVEGNYVFVHAGIRPGVPLDDQQPGDLMWIREAFLASTARHGAIVVHGHTVVAEPEEQHNRIAIDTGAFATGRLTCLVLSGTSREYLAT